MSFFKRISTPQEKSKDTTTNFFIGSPEAEGESSHNSKMKLGEIFGDFIQVFPELESEKFIITGRKGSGKTAIAEFIKFQSDNDPNSFCDFVKSRDLDSNKIIQLGKESGEALQIKMLFEWTILIKFISLLLQDESIRSISGFSNLEKFINRNSGFLDISSYEINEIVENKNFDINIEYFKRFFIANFGRKLGIKSHQAPFYKLIPNLRETVCKLLSESASRDNSYILIFDDLDIGFIESDLSSIQTLTDLLRVARDYNIDHFGRIGIDSKVIILLRDDIKRIIVNHNADTAKLFSSYEIPLIWYEQEKFNENEDDVALKQLINKRISINFETLEIPYAESDPWNSLIKPDFSYSGSSFKYLIDFTFYRPRDLILLFKSLPTQKFAIPLLPDDCEKLLDLYIEELVLELKNELSATFSSNDIKNLILVLHKARNNFPMTSEVFFKYLKENNVEYNPDYALARLFDYSVLGNLDNQNRVFFKHREKRENPLSINFSDRIIIHKSLERWLKKRA